MTLEQRLNCGGRTPDQINTLLGLIEKIEVFLFDVDETVAKDTDVLAGLHGVLPIMRAFHRQYLPQIPEGYFQDWQSQAVITEEDFLAGKSSTTMLDLLRGVARNAALELPEDELLLWNRREAVAVCEAFEKELHPMDGALEMLRALRDLGRFRAISAATSSVLRRAKITLESSGILALTDRVYSAQEAGWYRNGDPSGVSPWTPDDPKRLFCVGVPRGKPLPDVYNLACATEGVSPERTATIEDSGNGIRAAVAAGIGLRIGFLGSVPPEERATHREKLTEAGAHICVEHLSEVATLFA